MIPSEFRVLGALCVLAGLLLLAENLGWVGRVHLLWPVFPAVVGMGMVLMYRQRRRRDLLLLGVGVYLIGVSGLFFALNFTSWSALVWAWPVFIALLGLSSVTTGLVSGTARPVFVASGLFLLLLATAFFLVFGLSPRLWPISLTLFGLWILALPGLRGMHRRHQERRGEEHDERTRHDRSPS